MVFSLKHHTRVSVRKLECHYLHCLYWWRRIDVFRQRLGSCFLTSAVKGCGLWVIVWYLYSVNCDVNKKQWIPNLHITIILMIVFGYLINQNQPIWINLEIMLMKNMNFRLVGLTVIYFLILIKFYYEKYITFYKLFSNSKE